MVEVACSLLCKQDWRLLFIGSITVGGILLQLLQSVPHHFGYTVLLCLTFLYLLLGTSVIRRVKGTR